MNQIAPIVDFGQWSVEHLRLTIFHPSGIHTLPLWEQLMGVSPENRDERPREGVVHQQGEAGGNRLILTTYAERLDWIAIPNPTTGPRIVAAPVLVDINQTMTLMRRALDVSLHSVRVVNRLAFGALLGEQVANPSRGMSRLLKYLPRLGLEDQGVSDFVYQINRRRQSSRAPHAQLNRVARWSLEQIIGGEVRISAGQAPQQSSTEGFTNRLLLDVNTVPGNNTIAIDRIPGLFIELMEIAGKVASEGDII